MERKRFVLGHQHLMFPDVVEKAQMSAVPDEVIWAFLTECGRMTP